MERDSLRPFVGRPDDHVGIGNLATGLVLLAHDDDVALLTLKLHRSLALGNLVGRLQLVHEAAVADGEDPEIRAPEGDGDELQHEVAISDALDHQLVVAVDRLHGRGGHRLLDV